MNKNIFINDFIRKPTERTKTVISELEKCNTLDDLEIYLYSIATKYKTDKHGTTTWCTDNLIIRSGYYSQFAIPLSVTLKDNRHGSESEQIQCWDGFRKVCEIIKSGEYR